MIYIVDLFLFGPTKKIFHHSWAIENNFHHPWIIIEKN